MTKFTIPNVGALEFPTGTDGYWEFALEFAGRAVRFDFNVEDGAMTEALLEKVQSFVVDVARFDSVARSAIRSDYSNDPEGSSRLYLSHHAEEFSDEEMEQYFGSKNVASLGIDQLLDAIHLNRIGLYPDAEDYVAVFDYTIDADATNYILAVEFDASGQALGISMDS